MKLNSPKNCEYIEIKLTKKGTPIAYGNKIAELVEVGAYNSVEDAEKDNPIIKIDCEIYYEKHSGLFVVEEGAVESALIYSPYSGEECEDWDKE